MKIKLTPDEIAHILTVEESRDGYRCVREDNLDLTNPRQVRYRFDGRSSYGRVTRKVAERMIEAHFRTNVFGPSVIKSFEILRVGITGITVGVVTSAYRRYTEAVGETTETRPPTKSHIK